MLLTRLRTIIFPALCATIPLISAAEEPTIEAVQEEQAAIALDLAGTRSLGGINIDLAVATLRIREGALVPTTPVAGQVREWLFVGDALLVVDPPDAIEMHQLELYTGERRLREPVTEAVLVLASDRAVAALTSRPAAPATPSVAETATALFERWHESGERTMLRTEEAVLLDAIGDPLYGGYFGGFFRGETHGDFLIAIEPDAFEQVTVGRFEPLDLTHREKRRVEKAIAKAQRKGRWIGLELESLGAFENWMSMPLRDAQGAARHGGAGFDVEHYELDITLAPKSLDLVGTARIRLRAEGNRRALRLSLSAELAVHRVSDASGAPLFFRQSSSEILVILPERPVADQQLSIEIAYSGALIEPLAGTKARALTDTQGWYPQPETTDFATYDMTFRWPQKLSLFAAGIPGESGRDGELRWQRFHIDRPALLTSFEIGTYQIEKRRAGHVDIVFAFDPSAKILITGDRDQLIDAVGDALTYFEGVFGPYPYDHLTVVTAPRLLSQALPAMITLSTVMLSDDTRVKWLLGADEDPRAVIAHEIAHQWWGHTIGWQSYRDQWISEATANYAALLYMRNRLGKHGQGPTTDWQGDLTALTDDGRPIESMGPLVLGARLGSGPAPEAYSAIVYKKGAVVLDMLARNFGEETFTLILRRMLEAAPGRALSTGDFIELIERMTELDLSGFAAQFIYGTGLPEVYYDLRFDTLPNGRYEVTGTVRQEPPYRYVYRLEKGDQGRIDVLRDRVDQSDIAGSTLIVPVMISVHDPAKATGADNAAETGNTVALYHTRLEGRSTELRVELELEPKLVLLDPRKEVFARFYDRRRHPKQVLLLEGLDLAAAHRYDAAEARLLKARDAPVRTGPDFGETVSAKIEEIAGLRLDDRIGRALARLYLDQRRTQSADAALELAAEARQKADRLADRRNPRPPASAVILGARLTLLKGDAKRAYGTLHREVRKEGRISGREALALLAVAAREVGEEKVMREALDEAKELGVDVSVLDGEDADPDS